MARNRPQNAAKIATDNLQPDRQSVAVVTRADGSGRLLRHVEGSRETPVLDRMPRIGAGRRLVGRIGGDRRGGAEQKIEALDGCHRLFADQHDLAQSTDEIDAARFLR